MDYVLGRTGDSITDRYETAWAASAYFDAEVKLYQEPLEAARRQRYVERDGTEHNIDVLEHAIALNTVSVEVLDRELERLMRKLKLRFLLRRPWLILRREKAVRSSGGIITITY
jgi:hypothetical protein